ncbi:hypothetical protein [Silicimonas sp. MF1-12-2]|jgi:hypothetical protein|uniref:hypothetical protein n=1 Tax=Silicimonas sp. MF1-12-2 TaxID=3384793 RepID=UPI0039B4FCF2
MARESNTALGEIMEQVRGMYAANPMIAPQMEQFWKAQENILDATESFSKAWFERRHEAARSALDIVRTVNGNGTDGAASMRSILAWQQESFQRLAEDMQELADLYSNCASQFANAEAEASKEGIKEVEKRVKSAAKAKHATPV